MIFLRFPEERLNHVSYLVGSEGSALVLDPQRDVELYLQAALEHNLHITRVVETHVPCEYVSGARDLARRTGARLHLSGEGAGYGCAREATCLKDGDALELGSLLLRAVHAPGPTPEHLVFVLTDRSRQPEIPLGCFVGPLLAGPGNGSELALQQYFETLQKLRAWPAHLQLWPGDRAACQTGCSLGYVAQTEAAWQASDWTELRPLGRDGRGLQALEDLNREGPPAFIRPSPPRFGPVVLERARRSGVPIVDVREDEAYAHAHWQGSRHIPLDARFCRNAVRLLPLQSFYLVAENRHQALEAAYELARVGLDLCTGWMAAAELGNRCDLSSTEYIPPSELRGVLSRERFTLVDVRSRAEHERGHIPGSLHVPLAELPDHFDEIPRGLRLIVYAGSEEGPALTAASLLEPRGHTTVSVLSGGYPAWQSAGY